MKRREVGGITFKGTSDAEDFIDILFGEFSDGKPSFGKLGDQVITFQFMECLPDRGSTDPDLLG
jgi:hypothetical protein